MTDQPFALHNDGQKTVSQQAPDLQPERHNDANEKPVFALSTGTVSPYIRASLLQSTPEQPTSSFPASTIADEKKPLPTRSSSRSTKGRPPPRYSDDPTTATTSRGRRPANDNVDNDINELNPFQPNHRLARSPVRQQPDESDIDDEQNYDGKGVKTEPNGNDRDTNSEPNNEPQQQQNSPIPQHRPPPPAPPLPSTPLFPPPHQQPPPAPRKPPLSRAEMNDITSKLDQLQLDLEKARRDAKVQHLGGNANSRRVFRGRDDESVVDFVKYFNTTMNAAHIDDTDALLQLPAYLDGKARRVYDNLPDNIRNGDLRILLTELKDKLMTPSFQQAARARLQTLSQGSDSISEWACRVESVTNNAYADMPVDQRAKIAIDNFIRGLQKPIRSRLRRSAVTTMDQAILEAEAEDTVLRQEEQEQNKDNSVIRQLNERIQELEKKLHRDEIAYVSTFNRGRQQGNRSFFDNNRGRNRSRFQNSAMGNRFHRSQSRRPWENRPGPGRPDRQGSHEDRYRANRPSYGNNRNNFRSRFGNKPFQKPSVRFRSQSPEQLNFVNCITTSDKNNDTDTAMESAVNHVLHNFTPEVEEPWTVPPREDTIIIHHLQESERSVETSEESDNYEEYRCPKVQGHGCPSCPDEFLCAFSDKDYDVDYVFKTERCKWEDGHNCCICGSERSKRFFPYAHRSPTPSDVDEASRYNYESAESADQDYRAIESQDDDDDEEDSCPFRFGHDCVGCDPRALQVELDLLTSDDRDYYGRCDRLPGHGCPRCNNVDQPSPNEQDAPTTEATHRFQGFHDSADLDTNEVMKSEDEDLNDLYEEEDRCPYLSNHICIKCNPSREKEELDFLDNDEMCDYFGTCDQIPGHGCEECRHLSPEDHEQPQSPSIDSPPASQEHQSTTQDNQQKRRTSRTSRLAPFFAQKLSILAVIMSIILQCVSADTTSPIFQLCGQCRNGILLNPPKPAKCSIPEIDQITATRVTLYSNIRKPTMTKGFRCVKEKTTSCVNRYHEFSGKTNVTHVEFALDDTDHSTLSKLCLELVSTGKYNNASLEKVMEGFQVADDSSSPQSSFLPFVSKFMSRHSSEICTNGSRLTLEEGQVALYNDGITISELGGTTDCVTTNTTTICKDQGAVIFWNATKPTEAPCQYKLIGSYDGMVSRSTLVIETLQATLSFSNDSISKDQLALPECLPRVRLHAMENDMVAIFDPDIAPLLSQRRIRIRRETDMLSIVTPAIMKDEVTKKLWRKFQELQAVPAINPKVIMEEPLFEYAVSSSGLSWSDVLFQLTEYDFPQDGTEFFLPIVRAMRMARERKQYFERLSILPKEKFHQEVNGRVPVPPNFHYIPPTLAAVAATYKMMTQYRGVKRLHHLDGEQIGQFTTNALDHPRSTLPPNAQEIRESLLKHGMKKTPQPVQELYSWITESPIYWESPPPLPTASASQKFTDPEGLRAAVIREQQRIQQEKQRIRNLSSTTTTTTTTSPTTTTFLSTTTRKTTTTARTTSTSRPTDATTARSTSRQPYPSRVTQDEQTWRQFEDAPRTLAPAPLLDVLPFPETQGRFQPPPLAKIIIDELLEESEPPRPARGSPQAVQTRYINNITKAKESAALSFLEQKQQLAESERIEQLGKDVNVKLQYLHSKLQDDMRRRFLNIYNNICTLQNLHLSTMWTLLRVDPTLSMRALLKDRTITARFVGEETLQVTKCREVLADHVYYDHKLNDTCYQLLPVKQGNTTWYVQPGSTDLVPTSPVIPCSEVTPTVFWNGTHWNNHAGNANVRTLQNTEIAHNDTSQDIVFKAPLVFRHRAESELQTTPLLFIATLRDRISSLEVSHGRALASLRLSGQLQDIQGNSTSLESLTAPLQDIGRKAISEVQKQYEMVKEKVGTSLYSTIEDIVFTIISIVIIAIAVLIALGCLIGIGCACVKGQSIGTIITASRAALSIGERLTPQLRRRASQISDQLRESAPMVRERVSNLKRQATSRLRRFHLINNIDDVDMIEMDEYFDDDIYPRATSSRTPSRNKKDRTRKPRRQTPTRLSIEDIPSPSSQPHPVPSAPPLIVRHPNLLTFVPLVCALSSLCTVQALPIINVKIDNQTFSALPDTGSTITYCRLSTIRQLGIRDVFRPPQRLAQTADGTQFRFTAIVPLRISIGNITLEHNVLVAEDHLCPVPLLLGVDVFARFCHAGYSLSINFTKKNLQLGQADPVPFIDKSSDEDRRIYAITMTDIILPPNTDSIVPVSLDHEIGDAIIEPSHEYRFSKDANVGRTLCSSQGRYARILNTTDEPIEIKRGTRIAKATAIENTDEINTIFHPEKAAEYDAFKWENKVISLPEDSEDFDEEIQALDLSSSAITDDEKEMLRRVLKKNRNAFKRKDGLIGLYKGPIKSRIPLKPGATPVRQYPYRVPLELRGEMERQINELLRQGVIRPSNSEFSSPVLLVKKKNGTYRMCIDYRKLNAISRVVSSPLIHCDEVVEACSGKKLYSTMDISDAYFQTELQENHKYRSAFATFNGVFEFNRTPQGLSSSGHTFTTIMEDMRRHMPSSVLAYLDDVIVPSDTFTSHLKDLDIVLATIIRYGFRLSLTKCVFAKSEVYFLGHLIDHRGLRPDPRKTEAVSEYPRPTNVKEVRSFLGLVSYFRKFIPRFSTQAKALHELLQKDIEFKWTPECEAAFLHLKKLLLTAPILVPARPGLPYQIETDAAKTGLAAVLLQLQDDGAFHPISYISRTLTPAEKNYVALETESLAICFALDRFRVYIAGSKDITVITDHAPLRTALQQSQMKGRMAKFQLAIMEFPVKIIYRKGLLNSAADALSRHLPIRSEKPLETSSAAHDDTIAALTDVPSAQELNLTFTTLSFTELDIISDQERQEWIVGLRQFIINGTRPTDRKILTKLKTVDNYDVIEGILYEKRSPPQPWIIILSKQKTSLKERIMSDFHRNPALGAHQGQEKTRSLIASRFKWHRMEDDIRSFVSSCSECQIAKSPPPLLHHEPLGSLPITTRPMERLHVDLIGPLPISENGLRFALTAQDSLTKFVFAYALPDQKANTISRIFAEDICLQFGPCETLVTDNGTNLVSTTFRDVTKLLQVTHTTTTPYHQQSNGQIERFNDSLKTILRSYCYTNPSSWPLYLRKATYAYNCAPHAITKVAPFYLMYARVPRFTVDRALDTPAPRYRDAEDYGTTLRAVLEAREGATKRVVKQQQAATRWYDNKYNASEPDIPARVMVRDDAPHNKICRRWQGPYKVIRTERPNIIIADDAGTEMKLHLNRVKPYREQAIPNLPDVGQREDTPQDKNSLPISAKFQIRDNGICQQSDPARPAPLRRSPRLHPSSDATRQESRRRLERAHL